MTEDNPNNINVLKSNGTLQPLDYNKLNKMAEYAAEGLEDVSASEIAMNAKLHIVDQISTKEIQNALTDSAHDLISDISPGYQYAAARLFLVSYYKEVLGEHQHPHLYDHMMQCNNDGVYDPSLLKIFDYDEIDELNNYIDYSRDMLFSYAGLKKLYDTYAIQDRTTGRRFETPQQIYMCMSIAMHANEEKSVRMAHIKEAYDAFSNFDLSEPTPIMAGVRGTVRQYASCAKIQTGDSLEEITASASAASIYGAKRAGLGIDAGRIRAVDSKVGDGSTSHTGVVPFLKYFYGAQASCCVIPDTYVEILIEDNEEDIKSKKIKISDLKIGDKIKSYENGKIVYKAVTDKFVSNVTSERQRLITFENGTTLECSENHPIMCLENGVLIEKYPDELSPSNAVISHGEITNVKEIIRGRDNDPGYIDITVKDTHTFFCSNDPRSEMVLTHNSQGGIRKTSSTIFYNIWHLEFENLIVLKNNRGTEETRLRHVDYGVKLNRLFYKRLFKGEDITLFSPHDVPEMYEAFYKDTKEFERLYVEAENNPKLRKKTLKASTVFTLLSSERNGTGRIYVMNVDHANEHSAFNPEFAPVYQSNLCLTGDTNVDAIVNGSVVEGLELKKLNELFNNGTSNISVLSKNIETNTVESKKIQASALTKKNAKLMRITDNETGKSIRCTPEHKVYTKNRGYIEAKSLKNDDVLDIK